MDLPFYREYDLPWTSDSSQERKFQRLLRNIFITVLVLSLVWPFLPAPEPEFDNVIDIPPRIAQLLLEEQPLPPPPPPEPEPEEPEVEDEPEPEPEPEQVAEEPEPEPQPEPEPAPDLEEVAREQAQAAFMPFAEDLADLVDQELLDKVADDRELSASVGEAERNERSMITSKVGTASSGINTANMSRNTGGTGIAGRSTTKVDSPVAGIGPPGGASRTGTSGKASRSREEIELVFDKNKGVIFGLYNRALRNDPTLEGKLVLRMTIAPNGTVTFCEIVSSELGDPDLEAKLVARVKMFRFEAKDVEPITTTKPIDFFPA